MKIIEGLKKLKIILKKMDHNNRQITEYASKLSTEKPIFGSEQEQIKEVQSLVQSNMDLATEYLKIKKNIDYTNLTKTITICGQTKTVADFLILKRTIGRPIINTYKSLNDSSAATKQRLATTGDNKPIVERMFSEKEKNDALRANQDILDEIDGKLEIFNATEDLAEQF